jgi:hypothetical protein
VQQREDGDGFDYEESRHPQIAGGADVEGVLDVLLQPEPLAGAQEQHGTQAVDHQAGLAGVEGRHRVFRFPVQRGRAAEKGIIDRCATNAAPVGRLS